MSHLRAVLKSALLFRQQKDHLPQTLIFFVTSRCNARCEFCLYYDQIENPVAVEKELKVPEVEEIARRYGKLHYLALSGGEPFVRKDLEALCQAFIDHCGTAVVDIPSNFYYTKTMVATMEPLVRKNPGVIVDLQMSIDHIGKMHDDSRKVPGFLLSQAGLAHRWGGVRGVFRIWGCSRCCMASRLRACRWGSCAAQSLGSERRRGRRVSRAMDGSTVCNRTVMGFFQA